MKIGVTFLYPAGLFTRIALLSVPRPWARDFSYLVSNSDIPVILGKKISPARPLALPDSKPPFSYFSGHVPPGSPHRKKYETKSLPTDLEKPGVIRYAENRTGEASGLAAPVIPHTSITAICREHSTLQPAVNPDTHDQFHRQGDHKNGYWPARKIILTRNTIDVSITNPPYHGAAIMHTLTSACSFPNLIQ